MMLLICDTETSGLEPKKDPLIEVGLVRWSVDHACVIDAWSTLVQGGKNDAEKVNHIAPAALELGVTYAQAVAVVQKKADKSDVLLAHNAEFDRAFLPELGKPWVCSKFDLQWPNVEVDGESLVKIAVQNGVAVAHAHRALTDCMLLARLFERLVEKGHDVRAMIERGLRPKAEFLSLAPFEEKDKVKAAGFKWRPETKQWVRRMAVDDVAGLPFEVKKLEEAR